MRRVSECVRWKLLFNLHVTYYILADGGLIVSSKKSKVKVEVEVEVPEGDDEGVYREEFRRELAKRILNVMLDKDVEPAKRAVAKTLREKGGEG